MTNGEMIQKDFNCEVCEPIIEDDIIHVIFADKKDSAIGFDWSWWNMEYKEPTTKNDCAEQNGCITCSLDEGDECCRKLFEESMQEPTTKNDLPHCQHTDEEIAKSFIEDVEAVKDQLPCGEQMDFPNTFDEFVKDYGFRDKQEVYTNGSELIPVFRVKQWLEHISTTKNDLGVDCISRKSVIDELKRYFHDEYYQRTSIQDCRDCFIEDVLNHLPSVTPIRPKGHWIVAKGSYLGVRTACCSNCKDFYTHNWNAMNYCPNCGSDNREEEK